MRIGMLVDLYTPHVSGVTNYIKLNKKSLEELGHDVFVFTFGDEAYQDDEPNIIRSPGLPVMDTGYYFNLRYSKRARQLLRTMDIAHVHHPFVSGTLALSYCRSRGIPIIFTNHTRYDLYTKAYLPILPDVVGTTALEAYMPTFCRAVDLVIAPSNGMRQVLMGFGVDVPVEVIPNGVDIRPFRHPSAPLERSQLSYKEQDIILTYFGRLGPEKNLVFLLRSFAGAVQAYDHLKLLIIGDGPERENLEDRVKHMGIQERVQFTGFVPYEQLPSHLAVADAFVTASVTEVHPLSVIEAMAAGLPVLGINSPGVGDTVEDGVTGYLARDEDLAAFTAKMIRLTTEDDLRRQMGEQAAEAARNYAIDRTARLLEAQYEKVISQAQKKKRSLRMRMNRFLDRWRN